VVPGLVQAVETAEAVLEQANERREAALAGCRKAIRSSGSAIRALHGGDRSAFDDRFRAALVALRSAQEAVAGIPEVAVAGPLPDAEREVAEAAILAALLAGDAIPTAEELVVGVVPWLRALAEASSELRRALLDDLRRGEVEEAVRLFEVMDATFDALAALDFPDGLTQGLRRTLDGLRAVVERSRADLTLSVLQERLRQALA
jgi:translin